MCDEDQLIQKLRSLDTQNTLDFDLINKAIDWAKKYHDGQFRKSGEPFYTHPLQVAYMVSDHKLKTDVIVASILHDIIEDTEVTAGMLIDHFGWRIAQMVDRLTRDRPDGTKLSVEEILNNAYRPQDKEVLLIKLMDRLHNMQTVQSQSEKSQEKTALETLEHFLIASASINLDLEKELNELIYHVIPFPSGVNSLNELYLLSELKEKDILLPLNFENDDKQIEPL
jgi:(p)ppGpp synthase/HD superfamily hydrolase